MISERHWVVSAPAITRLSCSPIAATAARCDSLGLNLSLGFYARQQPFLNLPDQQAGSPMPSSRHRMVYCRQSRCRTAFDEETWVRFPFVQKRHLPNNMRKRRRQYICAAAPSPESFYDVLGVPPTATASDIKRAYRKLALKYHPDVYKQPDAQQKFMSIKNAYQTLVDSKMRSKYDSSKRSARSTGGFDWGFSTAKKKDQEEFYGIEDFFRDLQADIQRGAASSKPKSLWEELAEIGEEFVEFLEKELNIVDGKDQPVQEKENVYGFDKKEQKTSRNGTKQSVNTESKSNKAEKDIEDIEDMLTKLKKELGL